MRKLHYCIIFAILILLVINITTWSSVPIEIVSNQKQSESTEVNQERVRELNEALITAILRGDKVKVARLIKANANVNDQEYVPLILAIVMNHPKIVSILIKAGADINRPGPDEDPTPLATALLMGHTKIAQQLITARATLTMPATFNYNNNSRDPISIFAVLPNILTDDPHIYAQMIEILLKAGANPNISIREHSNWTILMDAASRGNLAAVERLIKAGAEINAKSKEGFTPCICAMMADQHEIVKRLKQAGADCQPVNIPLPNVSKAEATRMLFELDVEGEGDYWSLDFADEEKVLTQIYEISHLIKTGADINYKDSGGNTKLMSLLKSVSYSQRIVDKLIDVGTDVNIKNQDGDTALLIAAGDNRYSLTTIKRLIAAGADVNIRDKQGRTALIRSIEGFEGSDDLFVNISDLYFCEQIVKTLVAAGANINAKDNEGKTALMKAQDENLTTIVRRLIILGANK